MRVRFGMLASRPGSIGKPSYVEIPVSGADLDGYTSEDWRVRQVEKDKVFHAFLSAGWEYHTGPILVLGDEDES